MNNDVCFLITAYDQIREVRFTVKMLRTMWASTKHSPIVIVVSGDTERNLRFDDDPYTRIVHLDDMVGDKFKILVSTSIMRQIEHGMLEVKDLEREHGRINTIVHLHGDILLLGEKGFFAELKQWKASGKPIAADPVSPSSPITIKGLWGKDYDLRFFGQELMPQLFAVDHNDCRITGFMYEMIVWSDLERKATEWALIGNLHRCVSERDLFPTIDVWKNKSGPYEKTYNEFVYTVKRGRQQWGLHSHWGGFCHYGNSIHYTKEQRERRNTSALKQYGLDLSEW